MAPQLPKLAQPVAPLLRLLELGPEAAAAIAGARLASDGLLALETGGHLNDAARLASHALPKREAVWWACMCARAVRAELESPEVTALEAAENWVRKNSEPARRAAWLAAQATQFKTPESWACVAAFWSGGSLAPEGQPDLPPGPHLTGVAVCGSVVLSSVRSRPERQQERLARFLAAARDIALGGAGRLAPEEN